MDGVSHDWARYQTYIMKQAHVLNEMMVHIVNFTSDKGFSFFNVVLILLQSL